MKALLIFFFLQSFNIVIEGYRETEFDYMLELKTPYMEEKVVADCQSFINGLHFYQEIRGEWVHLEGVPLSEQECDWIVWHAMEAQEIQKPFCLMMNDQPFQMEISHDLSDCGINP